MKKLDKETINKLLSSFDANLIKMAKMLNKGQLQSALITGINQAIKENIDLIYDEVQKK